jgi:ATP-binding cassette subfamily B protein
VLRQLPGASFWDQLVAARQLTGGLALAACHLLQTILFLCAWWLVGRGAMTGNLDRAWLAGWALILLTLVPLRMLTVSLQGRLVIGVACLLKRRLLAGVLRLDLEQTKLEGVGMLFGRVLEANALEALMLGAGLRAVLATVDLALTVWVLANGAGGGWHAALFVLWTALTVLMVWRLWRRIDTWTTARLRLTHDLAERLVGHRTRLAQQPAAAWHEGEDELLDAYLQASLGMDRVTPWLAQATFGWRVVGMLGLALPLVAGTSSPVALAVAIGGVLLGAQSLAGFAMGIHSIGLAAIAWRRVAPVFRAAATGAWSEAVPPPAPAEPGGAGAMVVAARDVGFTYGGRGRAALAGVNLAVRSGDRLLLVGPSGGGKSTLVSLLSALRQPDTGLILCRGLDLATLGDEAWRRTVATAPQFHDNHVLSETFAFNLLMGRRWPPREEELREAEELCRELGLGELLDRMPSGMMQMVGDTGWQLSHGEQSRLFVARALLQDADLVILDESFGALDPVNLKRAVDCAWRRARTLLVIAHP